ncbi:alpha/beta fold hydrolase [Micromonospora endolithica]|uniref:Alpha/beta hydrolase n=1 Tax=Micromonospora endolithica TaxID=230091 RepID=A0A3A9YTE8_9ACTN|nr:alpha/beta hydrolase [Micromonospora endolithica]RKN39332.1 alpha/beta hydrolase [Micromonospora endolithica]TWJ22746.1 pimeloyl-ACP methyl ester carboxylesterase [Micromonospora endolithica]
MTTEHTLDVPGARLRYEVRGTGPLLLVMGSPMDAGAFASLADALADGYTVVTHDPRGISGSTIDDPEQDSTPELRADDVAALLDALGAGSADIFGSSGGAVTGLALAQRHPGRVRTLVAHEPPLLELLPDVEAQRAGVDGIIDTFHAEGVGPAWGRFMANAGYGAGPDDPPADQGPADHGPADPPADRGTADHGEPSAKDLANSARFFAHELRFTTGWRPDRAALIAGAARVVVGVGAESGRLLTHRTSVALAELLGTRPVEFPGDHGGFMAAPEEFAKTLRTVLAGH